MKRTRRTVFYRRKRQGKTDYKKRLGLLKSGAKRLVIRTSLSNTYIQVVEYNSEGDKVLSSATTKELRKLGWKFSTSSVPAAYLAGLLCAKKSKVAKDLIVDAAPFAGLSKGCRIYSALKGAVDGGIKVSASPEIFPSEDRIKGKHIAEFAKSIAGTDRYQKQFSACLKLGAKPEDFVKHFDEMKAKIMGSK